MSRGWHPVRVLLIVSLISGGLAGSVRAAPQAAPVSVSESGRPAPQRSTPDGATFSPYVGLTPLPSFTADTAQQGSFDQALAQIDRLEPIVRDLQHELDSSQFDLDALGAALEFDATQIVEFVRTEIAFEQYPGVLRGELGTLIGRAGNAFDQALLLRRLLDDAGYETRLVRTTLTEAQARALVAQMTRPRAPVPPIAAPDALADIRSRLQSVAGTLAPATAEMSTPEKYAAARDLVARDTSLLLDELGRAGVTLGQAGMVDELVQEARDYLWVQYRLSPYDPWASSQPAFGDAAAAPERLTIAEFYRDTLPDDLYHRVRLAVTVEQKMGDQLISTPVVANWERTAADLYGHPVTFQNRTDNLDPESNADIPALLKGARVFVPFIDGQMSDRAFDLAGGTYSASLLSLGALSLAQVGQSTIGAVNQLVEPMEGNSGAQEPDSMALTAEWIDYTLVSPDGQQTTFRRYVLDRVGETNRRQGIAAVTDPTPLLDVAQALLTGYTIMVLPGEYVPAYISHRSVERILGELQVREYITPAGGLSSFPRDEIAALIPLQDALLSGGFASAVEPGGDTVAYRAAPAVVVFEEGFVPGRSEETGYERVDVLCNARRVFSVTGGSVAPAPEEAVRIGVWETYAERAPLRQIGESFGALEAIRQATAEGIPLRVLAPGDGASLRGLQHSAATKASVQRDLDAGYTVILPERAHDAEAPAGWWRVNQETGETLGITSGGYGSDAVEYTITIMFALGWAALGYAKCTSHGGDPGCCALEAFAFATLGLIISVAGIELLGGALAFHTFVLGDIYIGGGITALPVDFCGH